MRRWIGQILLVSVMVFVPLAALAQMEGKGADEKGMMGDGMMSGMQGMMGTHGMGMEMGGGVMEMMKMMRAIHRLDLAPDQRKKFERLKLQHRKEAIPLFSRVRMAGVEIEELLLSDSPNLEKVKAKIREKHDALAELEFSHVALMQQVKGLLTPEQRERMEGMMMEMGPGMAPTPGSMMGPPKAEKNFKAAPGRSDGAPPETGDAHGH